MKNKNSYFLIPLFSFYLLTFGISALPAQAQDSNAYFIANQMLQSQNYERAYEMFNNLHRQNPENYIFLEKATESLINLKRYDTAIEITRQARNRSYYPARAGIRLGEIYHISGDTLRAFSIWEEVKKQNPRNMEIYLSMARAMRDRRAFEPAIETYKAAAKLFSDTSVLSSELANTYMKAGKYEESIQEYLDLIKQNPDRINYVQSTLLRFNDDYLYD
ncbi:MAG TPA: tetratricopeptide repeat protein, partial [Halalkalibaculum sp.]|nr:tetratricopeptide repeat protein [Halalkalibaculum sp.]